LNEERAQREWLEPGVIVAPQEKLCPEARLDLRIQTGRGDKFVYKFGEASSGVAFQRHSVNHTVHRGETGWLRRGGLLARVIFHRFN
jgi:hypothetical protein